MGRKQEAVGWENRRGCITWDIVVDEWMRVLLVVVGDLAGTIPTYASTVQKKVDSEYGQSWRCRMLYLWTKIAEAPSQRLFGLKRRGSRACLGLPGRAMDDAMGRW